MIVRCSSEQARAILAQQEGNRAFALPAVERLVAIGDLHGDFEKAQRAFRVGGLIDEQDRWTGGTTTAVQVQNHPAPAGSHPCFIALLFLQSIRSSDVLCWRSNQSWAGHGKSRVPTSALLANCMTAAASGSIHCQAHARHLLQASD